jgi:pilus assembly protein CpaF
MSLSDRLKQVADKRTFEDRVKTSTGDPLAEYKQHAREALFARLAPGAFDMSVDQAELERAVRSELTKLISQDGVPLSADERDRIAAEICEDLLGYGPIQRFLDDPTVTEIMVNSDSSIYVEREGRLSRTKYRFVSEGHVRRVIDRIVALIGRRIDEASPMVDARLPDGSRVNAIIPPLAVDGPALTVRKFSADPFTSTDLIRFGTLSPEIAGLLEACVVGRLNILITGGTGTGKTTLLNVFSSFIPEDQRVVTIEDAVELQLNQEHVIRLESRPPNIEGRGQVTIRDLVRNSLRMRPDRILIGEVRGAEAFDMLQAMNTGHEGSMSTLHCNSPRDGLGRLETMVLMSGMDLPLGAIRDYIASALSVIVHLSRLQDGSRKITHVTEVVGMEGTIVTLQDIFRFDFSAGMGPDGKHLGKVRPTGLRPLFAQHLADRGLELPPSLFDNGSGAR